jgi:(2Fe-2S) ferredoxin
MYTAVDKSGIDRIIDEHIIGGNPVEELLIQDAFWGDAIPPSQMAR